MKKSKTQKIVDYLMVKKSITSLEAFRLFNATRLASIILNLRRRGLDISTETIREKERSYAKYHLVSKPQRKH
jgi:hypothetical protein